MITNQIIRNSFNRITSTSKEAIGFLSTSEEEYNTNIANLELDIDILTKVLEKRDYKQELIKIKENLIKIRNGISDKEYVEFRGLFAKIENQINTIVKG